MAKTIKIRNAVFKRSILWASVTLLLLICTSFTTSTDQTNKAYRIKTIVIDAGHGGHDTGCLGSSAREKNVALSIALKLGNLIEDNFPDVKVIYTRKTDVFIELHERAAIANRNHADLFICIHCNSGPKAAYGVETYVMGLHKTDENLTVSMRENSSILLEKDYKQKYDGYDPNSAESFIIFNLYQNAYIEKSLIMASKVQYQADAYGSRYNRGVKQAGFLVLYRTAMPSVLIETGFLTNANEEKFLNSEKGINTMSQFIYKAFKEYKVDVEEGEGESNEKVTDKKMPEEIAVKDSVAPKKSVDEKNTAQIDARNETQKTEPVTKKEVVIPETDSSVYYKANSTKTANTSKIKTDSLSAATQKAKADESIIQKAKEADKTPNELFDNELFYTIQIGASKTATEQELKHFGTQGMTVIKADGMNRFTVGHYDSLEKANSKLAQLKKDGFKDAFVTPYYQGKRITIAEAKKLK